LAASRKPFRTTVSALSIRVPATNVGTIKPPSQRAGECECLSPGQRKVTRSWRLRAQGWPQWASLTNTGHPHRDRNFSCAKRSETPDSVDFSTTIAVVNRQPLTLERCADLRRGTGTLQELAVSTLCADGTDAARHQVGC
jgi:hypothetical protein